MSYIPATIRDLAAYWTSHGGVNLGIVGDWRHCSGYHLGRDRIFGTCACRPDGTCEPGLGSRDYSVQSTRDRAGLTDAASAIDLGKLGGSLTGLRAFSRWLVARCMTDLATRRLIREIIYSPDGARVQRYSGIDNAIHTGPGNGNASHIGHTHISFPRDTQALDKRPLFAPYFTPPDTSTGDDMRPTFEIDDNATVGSLVVDPHHLHSPDHSYLLMSDGSLHEIDDGFAKTVAFGPVIIGTGTILGDSLARRTGFLSGRAAAFFLATDVEFTELPDMTPFDDADVSAAVNLTLDSLGAPVAALLAAIQDARRP